jgi:DNA-directed RNA polymerase specialized sigma subunit
MEFKTIEHVEFEKDTYDSYLAIMCRGNLVLQKWHLVAKGKNPGLTRENFRGDLFKAKPHPKNGVVCVGGVRIPKSDMLLINAVRDIEWPMLQGYAPLLVKLSNQWVNCNDVEFSDLYDESVIALLNAIYGYSKPQWKFITYATNAIKRRILTVVNKNNPLSRWSNRARKLRKSFRQAEADAQQSSGGHVTFDEVCRLMGLSLKHRKVLESMLVKVIKSSDERIEIDGDSFQFSVDVAAADDAVVDRELDFDQKVAIDATPLDEWEQAVLCAYLESDGSIGWQTKVASEHLNPETRKAYTRMAPGIALARIRNKILATYIAGGGEAA